MVGPCGSYGTGALGEYVKLGGSGWSGVSSLTNSWYFLAILSDQGFVSPAQISIFFQYINA